MSKFVIRLATLTILSSGVMATAPTMAVFAAGGGEDTMRSVSSPPAPQSTPATRSTTPATGSTHRSKKANKQSFLSDPAFIRGYRTAYETIYDRKDYASAIDQLKALGHASPRAIWRAPSRVWWPRLRPSTM